MEIIKELGSRIRQRRQSLDITLKQVAEQIGVQEATVQRYESGNIKNIPYDKIVLISEALKCSPAYLMGWEDNLTKSSADLITDILTDAELLSYIKKISQLPQSMRYKVYGYIDSLEK